MLDKGAVVLADLGARGAVLDESAASKRAMQCSTGAQRGWWTSTSETRC